MTLKKRKKLIDHYYNENTAATEALATIKDIKNNISWQRAH